MAVRPTFVFGSPRSGTTWLARIFDSRPDTLYRHEPDICNPGELPYVFGPDELEPHVETMQAYAKTLVEDRSLRSNGLLPQFAKSYRSALAQKFRLSLLYAGRALEKATPGLQLDRKLKIPDLIAANSTAHPVIKSVSSMGRLPLLARSVEDCNIVVLVRHPCGVVASGLRGVATGKMSTAQAYHDWLKLEPAIRRGLTAQKLDQLSHVEVLATSWLLFNEYVLDALAGNPRVKVVVYEELCENPVELTQEIFDHCGFDDSPETRDFIRACLDSTDASPEYFQVLRNPKAAAVRWKSELSEADQQTVYELTRDSTPGRLFYTDAG